MKTFARLLWLLLLFFISQLWGVAMGVSMIPSDLANTTYDPSLIVELLITASAIGSIYLVWTLAKVIQLPLPNVKTLTKKDLAFIAGMTVVTRILAHTGVYILQQSNIEHTANDASLNTMFAHFSFPLAFIIIAICGPILEEWIFRAGIIGYLFESYPIIGVIVSSLIFGAMHMPTDLISWAIYGGIGLLYSWIYYKTKRLELVLGMHILHNSVSFWL